MGGVLLVTFLSRQEKQLAIGRNLSKPCIKNNELAPGHLILLGKSRYTPGHFLLLRNSPALRLIFNPIDRLACVSLN
jgi:hypothetical protein